MNASVSNAAKSRNDSRYRGKGRCWATPPEVFEPLNSEFRFTLDPCATAKSAKVARYFTEIDNGLVQDWSQDRVFMNPPYGAEIRPWIAKARASAEAGALVVALLPSETDSDWWHEHIVGRAEIRYLRGRVRFLVHEEDGSTKWASPFRPSCIVIWRPGDSAATCVVDVRDGNKAPSGAPWDDRIESIRKAVKNRIYPDGRIDDLLAAYDRVCSSKMAILGDRCKIAEERDALRAELSLAKAKISELEKAK